MSAPTCAPSTPLLYDAAQLSPTPFFVLEVALFTASEHPVELLLLLCWQLRFFEFLCDVPGSALYVCCECDHNWVMCVGMKNHTLENECIEKMVFRTERVECCSVGMYDGRLKLSVLHTLCITDVIT